MLLNDYKGQSCVAGSRIFVQEGIYDEFLKIFTTTAAHLTLRTGDPFGKELNMALKYRKFNSTYVLLRWTILLLTLFFSARDGLH